tara:strand:- start:938 stop:1963 length:1026 start_codon:yes stop_codon:yes gene_type:complete
LKIGISYWGFCEKFDNCNVAETPDGHRYGRPILVDELVARGHQVIALQKKRESNPCSDMIYDDGYPDIDVLFIEWRWPTYKNSGEHKFEPDLDRQQELLKYYHGEIPVIGWDTDLKIALEDEQMWPEMIICDPSLNPMEITRKRNRLTFWTDFKEFFDAEPNPVQYGYIGNNYDREKQFNEYYSLSARYLRDMGIQTTVHGNWLNCSPERDHPSVVIAKHSHVSFAPRVGFTDSMKALNKFICTTHISKDCYANHGNVTVRYFETLACNVPALVPSTFYMPHLLGKKWMVNSWHDVADAVRKISNLSLEDRIEVVQEQRAQFKKVGIFGVENTANFIESVV